MIYDIYSYMICLVEISQTFSVRLYTTRAYMISLWNSWEKWGIFIVLYVVMCFTYQGMEIESCCKGFVVIFKWNELFDIEKSDDIEYGSVF